MRKIILLFVYLVSIQQLSAQVYSRDLGEIHEGYHASGYLDMEILSSYWSAFEFSLASTTSLNVLVKTKLPVSASKWIYCVLIDKDASYTYLGVKYEKHIIDGFGVILNIERIEPGNYELAIQVDERYGWDVAPYFDYIINCGAPLIELGELSYGFKHQETNIDFLKQFTFSKREGQNVNISITSSTPDFRIDTHLRNYVGETMTESSALEVEKVDNLHSVVKVPHELYGDFQLSVCVSGKMGIKAVSFDYSFECLSTSSLNRSDKYEEDVSYIQTKIFENTSGTLYKKCIQYYDGLGFPIQFNLSNPSNYSYTSLTEFDEYGREIRNWLPVSSSLSNKCLKSTNLKGKVKYYYGDDYPYNSIDYEQSSRNRKKRQYGAGYAWHSFFSNRFVGYNYIANDETENKCVRYKVNGVGKDSLKSLGYYPTGTLFVVKTIDEDQNPQYEFRDTRGRLILSRQVCEGENYDTYYVYDESDNLCYVLPPMISGLNRYTDDDNAMKSFAYLYKYDHRDRCVAKRLPGSDWVYNIYDQSDQLIFTQNGVQRLKGEWAFFVPDQLGRIVLSGICNDTIDVSTGYINAEYSSTGVYNGYDIRMNDNPVNIHLNYLLQVNFYDTYDFLSEKHFEGLDYKDSLNIELRAPSGEMLITPKGLLTGSIIAHLEDSCFLYSTTFYNTKRQPVQMHSTNHLGGINSRVYCYNLINQIECCLYIYSSPYHDIIQERYYYSYDIHGLKSFIYHQLNNNESISLAEYNNNVRGLVVDKRLHDSTFYLFYDYDVRGYLIRNRTDIFNQYLYYNDGIGTPCYNGNISSMKWQVFGDSIITRGYQYSYDGLNRMTNALYAEGDSLKENLNHFNEQIVGYDKQGNILGLRRFGQTSATEHGLIDDLSFTLNGNQLMSVNDASATSAYGNGFEFNDGANADIEYEYDANGNLVKDLNKKILNIQYNCLNLPSRIDFESGNSVSYLYDANGTKLRTTHVIGNDSTTTDYCGNVIYENGVAAKLLTEEGYITLMDTVYHYFLKDHQGNNRVVVDQNRVVEEVNHYYPFGSTFASSSSSVQPYKYNGKELDRKGGLDWYDYGARHYDAVLGRWHAVDPLSEKYYNWSPYVYCKDNPILRIDVDGKDDYTVNNAGRLFRTVVKGSTSDRLMSTRTGVEPITVNDQDLLSGMYAMQDGKSGGLETYNSTSNLEEATAVFKFGADNTSAEWKLDIYNDGGNKTAIIGTSGKEGSVFSDKQSELDVKGEKVVDMHSHPYNTKASDQDMKNLKVKTGTIYHRDSQTLFFYNSKNSHIRNEGHKIDTSKTLLDKLNDKFMK